MTSEANVKSTPEFKSKKEAVLHHKGDEHHLHKSAEKNGKRHAQNYVTELPKSYMPNIDNAKLIKQINNCFNDNSFNNFNIGPVVMTANIPTTNGSKQKQKLNKSFENIFTANKYNLKNSQEIKNLSKKNLSSSPRRGSSSGKKSGSSKSGGTNKRKYLDQSYNNGKS